MPKRAFVFSKPRKLRQNTRHLDEMWRKRVKNLHPIQVQFSSRTFEETTQTWPIHRFLCCDRLFPFRMHHLLFENGRENEILGLGHRYHNCCRLDHTDLHSETSMA